MDHQSPAIKVQYHCILRYHRSILGLSIQCMVVQRTVVSLQFSVLISHFLPRYSSVLGFRFCSLRYMPLSNENILPITERLRGV